MANSLDRTDLAIITNQRTINDLYAYGTIPQAPVLSAQQRIDVA